MPRTAQAVATASANQRGFGKGNVTFSNAHHDGVTFQATCNTCHLHRNSSEQYADMYTYTHMYTHIHIHTHAHAHVSVLINDTHAHMPRMPTTERSLANSLGTE